MNVGLVCVVWDTNTAPGDFGPRCVENRHIGGLFHLHPFADPHVHWLPSSESRAQISQTILSFFSLVLDININGVLTDFHETLTKSEEDRREVRRQKRIDSSDRRTQ